MIGGPDNLLVRPWMAVLVSCAAILSACSAEHDATGVPRSSARVWGRRGEADGRFIKPRAAAADDRGRVFVVDMSGRIQRLGADGTHQLTWRLPKRDRGFPTGLGVDRRDGTLLVADTHRARILRYSPEGELRAEWGRLGSGPGEFIYPTDVAAGPNGNVYVTEYGDKTARVLMFDADGRFLKQWGRLGMAPGEFQRPMGLDVDRSGTVYVADSCNHRVQVFDAEGRPLRVWGAEGERAAQLKYPWDVGVTPDGNLVVCEFGNNRIQKFTLDGRSLAIWGAAGRKAGLLAAPWGVALGLGSRVVVVDALNDRLQALDF